MFDVRVVIGTTVGSTGDLVGDVPEVTGFVLMLDFDVSESGLVMRTEIDEFFATIDHAIVPHLFKSFIDAGDNVFVKSEGEVIPSTGGTKSTKLEFHIAALLLYEIPDAGIEFVARVFKTSVAFFFESALVDDPSFEAGVIGAGNIPSVFATEAVVASEGIFEGNGETMADVEIAVGVGGWHDKRITVIGIRFVGVDDFGRIKSAGMFPFGVDLGLESTGFVAFGEFHEYIIS